jgi:hypothetical protein
MQGGERSVFFKDLRNGSSKRGKSLKIHCYSIRGILVKRIIVTARWWSVDRALSHLDFYVAGHKLHVYDLELVSVIVHSGQCSRRSELAEQHQQPVGG